MAGVVVVEEEEEAKAAAVGGGVTSPASFSAWRPAAMASA